MKPRIVFSVLIILLLFSGCVVFSFYPLYTKDDLFPNDLLLGEWIDGDSAIWKFEYKYNGEHKPENVDSTAYILHIKEKDTNELSYQSLLVHIVKLEGNYFLDFYLEDYFKDDNVNFFDLHVLPVHSFAKVELKEDQAYIRWFDPDWLKKLIDQNRIRIHHENNGEHILLTAKPAELQKFVIKYVHSEEAFKDGLDADLYRMQK